MKESLIGKVLTTKEKTEFVILNEMVVKNLPCVYAANKKNEEEKYFFQITGEKNLELVEIKSKKMLSELDKILFDQNLEKGKARKINDNESIADYLAYLDEYYKTKVVNII